MSSSSPSDPKPNMVIAGRYRLDRHWAPGGMADVWQATDLQLSRTVAVKLLKPHLANDPTVAERFRREAISAANLDHPNIVTVHDAVEHDGRQAVIMTFVEGKSLRALLDEKRTLSPRSTIKVGTEICSALDAAHASGIIHRDVKPGNIMIAKDGRFMLTDFGISKALGNQDDLTSENIMMGTAKYLSPEQVRGDELGPRADIYSLGLVLYECLIGKVPFVGKTDTETALARLQRDATSLLTLRPEVGAELSETIHRMLARRPERRFSSGAEARAALLAARKKLGVGSADANGHPAGTDRTPTPGSSPAPDSSPTPGSTPTPGKVIRPAGHTPTPGSARPARDANGSRSTWKPSMALVGGLAVALIIGGALVVRFAGGNDDEPAVVESTTTVPTENLAPPEIAGVKVFDPEGDDGGVENDEMAPLTTDGNAATIWQTDCYKTSTFGSKSGVGLVISLAAPVATRIDVDLPDGGWAAEIYASTEAGASLAQWGQPIATGSSGDPGTLSGVTPGPVSYALVFLREAGRNQFCSNERPFRGTISDIRVAPIS